MVTATRLTYQDYLNTPDDERCEIIDGERITAPTPNTPHQRIQSKMGWRAAGFVEERDLGIVFFAPTDVVLSNTDVVQPDLLFISKERTHIITTANIQAAPDLVVEILSPATARRDWHSKRQLYARHGVKEYWLVDPSNKIVWLMLLRNGTLEIEATCYEGDTLTSPTLSGFSLSVNDIF